MDAIGVGDIIFAVTSRDDPKIMLVTDRRNGGVSARSITSQSSVEFSGEGWARQSPYGGPCRIISTARLPREDTATALGLDKKMGDASELNALKLSAEEIEFLLHAESFFRARPLPE